VRGEPGHDIIPELTPVEGEPVIDKPGKGAFYQTDLELMLKNREIDTLLVCGVTTEVCVNTTVREANDRGFRCIVLSDCCASYFPDFHRMGLEMIKAQGGIFGWVSSSTALLNSLAAST
jgi:biuret amidohydrolase